MMLNVLSQQTPKSSRKLEFREQFSPRLISALYKNFKDANSAILELIDNAIDDRIPGKLFVITVEVHGNKITIKNKGGKGMGPRELEVFFIWGQSKKRGKLGRYGQGGKAAMGYLGKSWKISTTKAGDKNEYIIEEKNWDDRSGGMKRYIPLVIPARLIEDGVVQIDIWNLKKKIHKKELAIELSNVYRPLIQSEEVRIIVNGKRLMPFPIPLYWPEDKISFKVNGKNNIYGWLSILEAGSSIRGGVRCYEYGRLISEKEIKAVEDAGNTWKEFLKYLLYQQKEGTLPGLPIDIGQKPPTPRKENRNDTEQEEMKIIEKSQYNPATPPPLDKIGARKRTGGYLRPIPKPLPETDRYQIGEENGEKVIFINTRFPIYKLRRNQLHLYTCETLVCEYAKSEDPESQTVKEYIEDMNEMLKNLGIFIKTKKIKI